MNGACVAAVALAAALAASSGQTELSPPAVATPDPATVARGERLALLGNCNVCHTASGGRSYAGGRPLRTPFGVMYAPNITPDRDTGIGRWSESAFVRAMREGVDADGRDLYPAFPYDHYTRVADDDARAIYAFLMTREPVHAPHIANELRFPFNIRPLVRVWKLLYFRRDPFVASAAHDAQWNRGAYLVEGLAHCGACHTPRNALGAEEKDARFEGGDSEGWRAPPLGAASPSPVRWTADTLATYLRKGLADEHEVAAGPMAPVVDNLARVPADDVRAIAAYVASLGTPQESADSSAPREAGNSTGAGIYEATCARCHDERRGETSRAALPLERSTSVALSTPDNLIRIVLDGIALEDGEAGRSMPGFAAALNDAQVAALASFVRTRFAHASAWPDATRDVARIRNDIRRQQ